MKSHSLDRLLKILNFYSSRPIPACIKDQFPFAILQFPKRKKEKKSGNAVFPTKTILSKSVKNVRVAIKKKKRTIKNLNWNGKLGKN